MIVVSRSECLDHVVYATTCYFRIYPNLITYLKGHKPFYIIHATLALKNSCGCIS